MIDQSVLSAGGREIEGDGSGLIDHVYVYVSNGASGVDVSSMLR